MDVYSSGNTLDFSYARWTLNGSQLQVVIAGKRPANSSIPSEVDMKATGLPQFVLNKLYPLLGVYLGYSTVDTTYTGYSKGDSVWSYAIKHGTYGLVVAIGSWTLSIPGSDSYFRITYNFIIDLD